MAHELCAMSQKVLLRFLVAIPYVLPNGLDIKGLASGEFFFTKVSAVACSFGGRVFYVLAKSHCADGLFPHASIWPAALHTFHNFQTSPSEAGIRKALELLKHDIPKKGPPGPETTQKRPA